MSDKKQSPRKRFGQHFLTDQSVLNRIVAALDSENDFAGQPQVVEIGPGRGALTDGLVAALQKKEANLIVVEIDRDLVARLRQRYPPQLVKVIQADILRFDLRDAIAADNPHARLQLLGNLPYNISTPLIFHLLAQVEHIHDMLFMLQKEVALRLCAQPGNKNYGRLSVMAAVELDCEPLFDIPPEAFDPPPKVDSTLLRLRPKKQPLKPRDRALFNAVVAAAFSQRRKTLRNALAKLVCEAHFIRAEVDAALRAEALSVEQYLALADAIAD